MMITCNEQMKNEKKMDDAVKKSKVVNKPVLKNQEVNITSKNFSSALFPMWWTFLLAFLYLMYFVNMVV